MSEAGRRNTEAEIYDYQGRRKYLTPAERQRFWAAAMTLREPKRSFCLMFYFVGARISEILETTPARLDLAVGVLMIRTLKRRKSGYFRAVPVPRSYLRDLSRVAIGKAPAERLWSFSRKTGYRIVKAVMKAAGISGGHACPKGLRHGFGIVCTQKNIPLPTISKWMGHSSIKTTAIYLNAVGPEERAFAKRIW